ncbi:uncharacterized protein LOC121633613 [Melanotaenia boesemani]|uniref:uncharacterized protein LOC121633613 n=1 Tax=Melanotaenia boesemani TaxID=1250792 RepID=UPI001C03AF74|nr:uncharacterized protein LOC121633613 [Melanotaenia boesemani]
MCSGSALNLLVYLWRFHLDLWVLTEPVTTGTVSAEADWHKNPLSCNSEEPGSQEIAVGQSVASRQILMVQDCHISCKSPGGLILLLQKTESRGHNYSPLLFSKLIENKNKQSTVYILEEEVEVVEEYQHLGVRLDKRVDWECNTGASRERTEQTLLLEEAAAITLHNKSTGRGHGPLPNPPERDGFMIQVPATGRIRTRRCTTGDLRFSANPTTPPRPFTLRLVLVVLLSFHFGHWP